MSILITGASGYIGNKLAHSLANQGEEVHALVRSDATDRLLDDPSIKIYRGDIMNKESLVAAMKGCRHVYHTAARVGAWAKNPSAFYDVNVKGTINVLNSALECGVEKTVFTSTCGVIGPSFDMPMDEDSLLTDHYYIDYDRSKKLAEDLVNAHYRRRMNVVIVSPSKVYGPGHTSHSLTANAIINKFLKYKIIFIPFPGTQLVCFAFIDDIVNGHVLAMQKGLPGEKYILGGTNVSYINFFRCIRSLSQNKGRIIHMPKTFIQAFANLQALSNKVTGAPIRITKQSVNYLFKNYTFSSNKAIRDLGYKITPIEEGLNKTIQYLTLKHKPVPINGLVNSI